MTTHAETQASDVAAPPDFSDQHGPPPNAIARTIASGVVGAAAVTLLNEAGRRLIPHAPRVEVLGERALSRGLKAVDLTPPKGRALFRWTLAGDLLGNSLYYSLVGVPPFGGSLLRGGLLGAAAGAGAVFLPRRIGLGRQPKERAPLTPLLTVAWYTLAGLAAAGAHRALGGNRSGQ